MIEFYHKDRRVGEFKENFGWNYIVENGITKIFVNIQLNINELAFGCAKEDYERAIKEQFKRTFELSSGGRVTGEIFFTGTQISELPQIIPSLNIIYGEGGKSGQGRAIYSFLEITTPYSDEWDLLMELSTTAVHEILHSIRLDHPFERIQTDDSWLRKIDINDYKSTDTTDPLIQYNIMNYGDISIDGILLKNLWKFRLPEYLTKRQISMILKEIDSQREGAGCMKTNMKFITIYNEEYPIDDLIVSEYEAYWEYDRPGKFIKLEIK